MDRIIFALLTFHLCFLSPAFGESPIPCADDKACGPKRFCMQPIGKCKLAKESDDGVEEMKGICQSIPENCLEIYKPVCSCTMKTYSNHCAALMQKENLRHLGECKSK